MKKAISLLLSAVMILCVLPFSAFAVRINTYYIDSENGNDANSGLSEDSAWQNADRLSGITLLPGDRVLFKKDGRYPCTLTLTAEGTKKRPVIISSYGGGNNAPLLYTDKSTEVLRLFDCSYVTVDSLEITAHNGGGIWIDTLTKESKGITLNNLKIHDIQNCNWESRDTLHKGAAGARACVMVKGLPANTYYPVNDLTVTNCEMYDCGNGISLWGSWNRQQNPFCDESEVDPCYNENTLVKNVYFHDMAAEAIIVGICKNALITNCRAINCCQDEGTDENGNIKFFNAAMWFWGSQYSTIQYCEIAGQKNKGDGMSVDFDSFTHNCTYQYIYSHDNNCFMCNCAINSGQHNNTVRYCLSVNDNGIRTRTSASAGEYNFKFYNNTIINCNDFYLINLHDSLFANNIIVPKTGCLVTSDAEELISFGKRNNVYTNNCYYNCPNPVVDLNSLNTLPGFANDNYVNPDSFRLGKGSSLIGAGIDIENAPDTDFFGGEISNCNIGCYAGNGENSDSNMNESPLVNLLKIIMSLFRYLINLFKK